MDPIDASFVAPLLRSAVTAFSVLGGVMAYCSGFLSARALIERRSPTYVARNINEGVGWGFTIGMPLALIASIIELWTR